MIDFSRCVFKQWGFVDGICSNLRHNVIRYVIPVNKISFVIGRRTWKSFSSTKNVRDINVYTWEELWYESVWRGIPDLNQTTIKDTCSQSFKQEEDYPQRRHFIVQYFGTAYPFWLHPVDLFRYWLHSSFSTSTPLHLKILLHRYIYPESSLLFLIASFSIFSQSYPIQNAHIATCQPYIRRSYIFWLADVTPRMTR